MPTIAEVREKYPQYSDMSDADLASALHKKFYSDMPAEEFNQKIGFNAEAKAPDDHGLARRQAMSATEKAVSPITEYPRNYAEMNQEARDQISRGAGQLYEGAFGSGIMGDVGKFAGGLGNVALGTLGYVGSPISAAYRSVIGQPVEDITGIPREYTEFGAQLATPGIGLTKLPEAPGLPVNPGLTRIRITKPDELPGGTGPSGADAAAAMQRLRDQGIDVDVPRAITSDNTSVQRTGQGISKTPIVGDPLAVAVHDTVPKQIQQARDILANQRGNATEANAAGRAGAFVSDAAAAEKSAAEEAALQSDSAVAAAHQKAVDDANAAIAAREAQSAQTVEARTGTANPQDTGAAAIEALRAAEAAAKENVNRLYDVAGKADAAVRGDEVSGAHARVAKGLDQEGVVLDPLLTPAASRMLDDIKRLSGGEPEAAGEVPRPTQASPATAPAATALAPRAASKSQSLTEFLASKGGLGPDAELGAIGADKHLVDIEGVGRRKLVKQGGSTLDYAREAAEEAGYLPKGSTPNDLLDALDAEMRGNKRYPQGFEGSTTSREATAAAERARAEQSALRRGLESDLNKAGYDQLGPDVRQRTLKIMENERADPDTAVEKAIRQLDNEGPTTARSDFPGDRPPPGAAGVRGPVSVQDIEQARKRLVFLRSAASNDADRRAATNVMRQFDEWQSDAFEKALLSGDPEALANFRKARDANRDWRERFGYNEKDDVNNIVQKILHKDVTPQEVANWLVGSGKVGKQGTTSRLYDGLMKATGNNPELAQSIQGAIWDTLSNSKTAAADIREFVHKSGRDLAEKVFPQGSRELMLRHADMLDQGKAARDVVAEVAENTKPGKTTVEKGPLQQLAARVIGGKADKPEALWKTIEGYTREGGDVRALAMLMRQLPADMKGDIAGAVVRGLGDSARTGQFSLDAFASDWGKITPQAKAVLFGNAGEHVKALDDIATIAQRMKDVKGKYGNPSGTAQITASHQLAAVLTGVVSGHFAPGTTLAAAGGAIGGNIGARILASPASASSLAKYAKALERQAQNPTPASQALVGMTERNLVNTIKTFGATRALPQSPRLLQGPVPAGAENEQR
jgi:hypothetical protein